MSKKTTIEEFIERAEKVHGKGRYGYDKIILEKGRHGKENIWCPKCNEYFEQIAKVHLNGSGCKRCYLRDKVRLPKKKLTIERFIGIAQEIHGNLYDYSLIRKLEKVTWNMNISVICKEHGVFKQRVLNHINLKQGCSKCNGGVLDNLKEFIEKAREVHGNKYEYDKVIYENNRIKVEIFHKECEQYFWQIPKDHLRGHGCHHCFYDEKITIEEFVKRAKEIHGDKYNYDETLKCESYGRETKIPIFCKKCGKYFYQTIAKHILAKHGCQICAGNIRLTKEEFIERARKTHGGDFSYDRVVYKNNWKYVEIKHNRCGRYFWQRPNNHINGRACPHCKESNGEKRIYHFLEERNVYYERNKWFKDCKNPKTNACLFFDFYLPEYNALIEYDGEFHYLLNKMMDEPEVALMQQQYRDGLKDKYSQSNKIKLIRISYKEFDKVEEILIKELKFNPIERGR